MKCPCCNCDLPDNARFCLQCGAQITRIAPSAPSSFAAQRCRRCGCEAALDALFCPECYTPFDPPAPDWRDPAGVAEYEKRKERREYYAEEARRKAGKQKTRSESIRKQTIALSIVVGSIILVIFLIAGISAIVNSSRSTASSASSGVDSSAAVDTTHTPDLSFMDGTWRDEVYREGSQSIQFEVIINTSAGTVDINSITENARTVMSKAMPITEYGEDYVVAGGYVFAYLDGDLLDVNSALFTNPPLKRYSDETVNDAFGVNESDYRKSTSSSSSKSSYMSDDIKGALWALAEKAVKNDLKSPSTAKFPASYGSSGVSFSRSGELYAVSAYVDAENGFGATVRQYFTVYGKLEGTTMKLDHVDYE